ncbi:hypothetical protein FAZ95_36490 [Trinickia violacea]|uniref:Terminase large subunit gp17-like C-terminal domain-containing protein n=1 Tax=Trinickia violacea TaxID=2571746 RepID=A0A4P8J2R4_9BURK|nr:phage terminase large subunit [Trinickia violacea]QCP54423.1 hypothetical protein FAZ95_36490 [Trinickia violacea]
MRGWLDSHAPQVLVGPAGIVHFRLTRQLLGYRVISSPETGDKVTRAEPFAAQVNAGNVLMLRGDWDQSLIAELRTFPFGTHDDEVDALSRAFALLIERRPMRISDAALAAV